MKHVVLNMFTITKLAKCKQMIGLNHPRICLADTTQVAIKEISDFNLHQLGLFKRIYIFSSIIKYD